jgi:putative membrane protein insertion efficiency factor
MKNLALTLIILYQRIRRYFPKVCRFYPSCSDYAKQAIEKYGLIKGGMLAAKRIVRCHPLNPGGYDPVP